jgi:hypothetical protein
MDPTELRPVVHREHGRAPGLSANTNLLGDDTWWTFPCSEPIDAAGAPHCAPRRMGRAARCFATTDAMLVSAIVFVSFCRRSGWSEGGPGRRRRSL